jgi:hypothetical protein
LGLFPNFSGQFVKSAKRVDRAHWVPQTASDGRDAAATAACSGDHIKVNSS